MHSSIQSYRLIYVLRGLLPRRKPELQCVLEQKWRERQKQRELLLSASSDLEVKLRQRRQKIQAVSSASTKQYRVMCYILGHLQGKTDLCVEMYCKYLLFCSWSWSRRGRAKDCRTCLSLSMWEEPWDAFKRSHSECHPQRDVKKNHQRKMNWTVLCCAVKRDSSLSHSYTAVRLESPDPT